MSYITDDPASCPLCLCDCGLPHLADRPILVAWRAGRESYEVPWANGESTYAANPYADGSTESWAWGQGRQSVARLDRKSSHGR